MVGLLLLAHLLESAGDCDHGAIDRRQVLDHGGWRDVDAEPLQHFRHLPPLTPPRHPPPETRLVAANADVLDNRRILDQTQVLVDERHAAPVRLHRRERQRDIPAMHDEPTAFIWLVEAGEDLDQRGLPRPVLAYEPVDLTR